MKMKRILSLALVLAMALSLMLMTPAASAAVATSAAQVEKVSGETITIRDPSIGFAPTDTSYETGDFYLYSPNNPHQYDLLSGFMNGVIYIYPDKGNLPANEQEVYDLIKSMGLDQIAEGFPAYIIVPVPSDGNGDWTKADADLYTYAQWYMAGGPFNPVTGIPGDMTDFPRRTMNTLQYVVAEGSGSTFVNNYLSQTAHHLAAILTFGGTIDGGLVDSSTAPAIPAYLVGAGDGAADYWKSVNGATAGSDSLFYNPDHKELQVITASGGDTFDSAAIQTAWAKLLSRTMRLGVVNNLVENTMDVGNWVIMAYPNLEELGIKVTSFMFDPNTGKADAPYTAAGGQYTGLYTKATEGDWVGPPEGLLGRGGWKTIDKMPVHVFIPDNLPAGPVPLVIGLHGLNGDPLEFPLTTGWAQKAAEEGFILIAPNNINATSNDLFVGTTKAIIDYMIANYTVDTTRIYITGFSMGGMATAAVGKAYPGLFAAMAPMGSQGGAYDAGLDEAKYDIPVLMIQGSIDGPVDIDGSPAFGAGEAASSQDAVRQNFTMNEVLTAAEAGAPDYKAYPYWGYKYDDSDSITDKGMEWKIYSYNNDACDNPVVRAITLVGAGHSHADYMATLAWDFLSKFSRAADGALVEGSLRFMDCSPSDWFFDAVNLTGESGLFMGKSAKVFDPKSNVTIAEYLTVIYRIGQEQFGEYETTGANWQDAAKAVAAELGLDFPDMGAAMTRGEMAAITTAYLKSTSEQYEPVEPISFTDIGDSQYAEDISWFQGVGGINGYNEPDGSVSFRPDNTILRSETAQVIANLIKNVI